MNTSHFASRRGFSLVELVVVMAIIALLAVLAFPSLTGVLGASSVSRGGQTIEDSLKYASEYALAHRVPVEVRFYNYGGAYQALQLFTIPDTGNPAAVTSPINLPNQIVMLTGTSSSTPYSTLLQSTLPDGTVTNTTGTLTAASGLPSIPAAGTNYTYSRFAFRPDGSTDLTVPTTSLYYITVAAPLPSPPKNFYTISIDYENGKVTSFRP